MLRIKFLFIICLLGMIGLLTACSGVSPREQALEATVSALQNQVATSSAPTLPATAAPITAPDWRKQFIGLTYPPMPDGWEYTGGAMTFSTCDLSSPCASGEESYGVAFWRQVDPAAGTAEELLVFEKQLGYDFAGMPIQTVLDVLVGSEVGGTNWLTWGCRVGDSPNPDNEIVALYSIITDPSSPAWRANHLTGRFEPISTEGLICVDENAVD